MPEDSYYKGEEVLLRGLLILVVTNLACSQAAAEVVEGQKQYDQFFELVQPLLQAKCVQCHGPDKQEGELRLDSRAAVLRGGDSGPAIIPGDVDKSLLIKAIRHQGDVAEMPPKEMLKKDQIDSLVDWVKTGATWPARTLVLFEDEQAVVAALNEGSGPGRLDHEDHYSGQSALVVAPQKHSPKVSQWNFAIREKPATGEYRYLRFAWKKRGGGALMFEVANGGKWREKHQTNGAWVAGNNTTGWAAFSISKKAPDEWDVVTCDLWKDGQWGDFSLTGMSLTSIGGGEALIDAVLLGPTLESLDAYRPGRGQLALKSDPPQGRIGNAWSDPQNPIVKIFKGQRLDLWSLKPPRRPELPQTKTRDWVRNPIDAFILAGMESHKLQPSPEADRRTLIRRLYFDLIGLPPTPQEVRAFVADSRADAYEQLVERLLASRHYGERWGRHWLDVIRYSDTNNFERDEFRPQAWRFRDYVIRSFNQDKPYDQMIKEHLAGDEMLAGPPQDAADADRLIATGYLRLGPYDSTASIFEEDQRRRDQWMADLADTTGSAFMGLTMACCRCHDHKYDPLSQADHFRLRAFFAAVRARDDMVVDVAAVQAQHARHNARLETEIAKLHTQAVNLIDKAKERIINKRKAEFPADILSLLRTDAKQRDKKTIALLKPYLAKLEVKEKEALAALDENEQKQHTSLTEKIATLEKKKKEPTTILGTSDSGKSAPATNVFFQGDFTQPRDEVVAGFLSVVDPNPATIPAVPNQGTTGRRSALADWLTSDDHPLTARVMVNRLWQHHFGRGIVTTPSDFGYSGARPTHPALLDWLSVEFCERGWSIKQMHRLMVQSATYRQSSLADPKNTKTDPENRHYWRQNIQRLDAETIRDSLLAVSGRLLPDDSGTPRWPPVPEDILKAQPAILEAIKGADGGRRQGWYADPVEKTYVRSVFLVQKQCVQLPFLQAFDLPEMSVSCARRSVTTVAPQALMMMNSPLAIQMAHSLAQRVRKQAGKDQSAQVNQLYWLTLSRGPTESQRKACLEMLARHEKIHQQPTAALTDLCRALLNVNEFVYID